ELEFPIGPPADIEHAIGTATPIDCRQTAIVRERRLGGAPFPGLFLAFEAGLDRVEADARPLWLDQESLGQRLIALRCGQRAALQLLSRFVEDAKSDFPAR